MFTDEDLARLKKAIVDHLEARAIAGAYELPALLTRLEAAEYALNRLQPYDKDDEAAIATWRTSAGK